MKWTFPLVFLGLMLTGLLMPSFGERITTYHETHKWTNSAFPPAARTGAPGEGNCTSCHSGSAQSASGVITVAFSGSGDEYVVGESYTITISIASGSKNGFEMTILDDTNTKAGTFTSGTNYALTTLSGRQYARQSTSTGITSWTVNWTAPDTDAGDLTLYYCFNKTNSNSSSSGDVSYLGQFTISSAVFNTVTEYEQLDAGLHVWYSAASGLQVSYELVNNAATCILVQDVSGRVVYRGSVEQKDSGNYTEQFSPDQLPSSGMYIVSLFIDNKVFNRKIYFGDIH